MPARLTKRQSDTCRKAIQTSVIVNRLQKHVDGSIEMSMSQIRAAEILLKKALPDLSSVEVTGDDENPLVIQGGLAPIYGIHVTPKT